MIDKELAEDYFCDGCENSFEHENGRCSNCTKWEFFIEGLKAGRPKWHKMDYKDEKSFKNIPRYTELLTKYDCGLFVAHCVNEWTGNHWCEHSYGVIAWCEILEE